MKDLYWILYINLSIHLGRRFLGNGREKTAVSAIVIHPATSPCQKIFLARHRLRCTSKYSILTSNASLLGMTPSPRRNLSQLGTNFAHNERSDSTAYNRQKPHSSSERRWVQAVERKVRNVGVENGANRKTDHRRGWFSAQRYWQLFWSLNPA